MRVSTSAVVINATPESVWTAVTDAEYVRQWQYGSVLDTLWQVGGPIRFTSEWEGQTFEQWGSVLFVDAPRQLRYSLFAPRDGLADRLENYFTMTYDLEVIGGATRLTITQEDPREPDGERADESDDESPVLLALKGVAESMESGEASS